MGFHSRGLGYGYAPLRVRGRTAVAWCGPSDHQGSTALSCEAWSRLGRCALPRGTSRRLGVITSRRHALLAPPAVGSSDDTSVVSVKKSGDRRTTESLDGSTVPARISVPLAGSKRCNTTLPVARL